MECAIPEHNSLIVFPISSEGLRFYSSNLLSFERVTNTREPANGNQLQAVLGHELVRFEASPINKFFTPYIGLGELSEGSRLLEQEKDVSVWCSSVEMLIGILAGSNQLVPSFHSSHLKKVFLYFIQDLPCSITFIFASPRRHELLKLAISDISKNSTN